MRYFFHFVSNCSVYEDPKGEYFSSVEEATSNACIMATQLKTDAPDKRDQIILVTHQQGTELARVVIAKPSPTDPEGGEPK